MVKTTCGKLSKRRASQENNTYISNHSQLKNFLAVCSCDLSNRKFTDVRIYLLTHLKSLGWANQFQYKLIILHRKFISGLEEWWSIKFTLPYAWIFISILLCIFQPTQALLEEHYGDLKEKPFFPGLIKYVGEGPVVAMVSC